MHKERASAIAREVKDMLEAQGAILYGHFIGTSGKHLDTYLNKDALFTNPAVVAKLGEFFAELFAEEEIDVVAGPATGGALLAHETARQLRDKYHRRVSCVFTEKGTGGAQELRRGYDAVVNGTRVLVVEDIVNTGGSLQGVLNAVSLAGGHTVGAAAIVNRNPCEVQSNSFTAPFTSLLELLLESYDEDEVPEALAACPVRTDVGHGAEYLKKKKG